jgi:hypothetical protein
MLEKEFQKQVIELAKLFGWKVSHQRPAKTARGWRTAIQGDAGFPDLVLARRGAVIFAELKREAGKTTEEQDGWLGELGPTTEDCLVTVWRPSDWAAIQAAIMGGTWEW